MSLLYTKYPPYIILLCPSCTKYIHIDEYNENQYNLLI